MTVEPLKILLVEDSDTDAELADRFMRKAGLEFVIRRVQRENEFVTELDAFRPDVILADYNLPEFDCLGALRIALQHAPETPFIVFSGSIGDERAVEVLKLGAHDYVLKDRMQRLPAAILRAHHEAQDALERRRAEASLHHEKEFVTGILEATENLVAVFDLAGQVVRVNRAFERLVGARDSETLTEVRALAIDVASGRLTQCELTLPERNGSRRTVLWHGSLMLEDSEPRYVVVFGADLTEMRSLESQVAQSRRVDSLGRMAATVAHEFNNVLVAIGHSAELIRRKPGDAPIVQQASERIASAVSRGARIAQEIMRFTRPAPPALSRIEVSGWLSGFVDEIRGPLGNSVTIVLVPPPRELVVLADSRQLDQVFTNLASNARDAMGGTGTLTIVVDEIEEAGRLFVRIAVADQGSGVTEDILATIFEPLFTTKREGTGLGLTVSHQIVTTHGGRIFAESEGGRGTTIHVLLPVAAPD